MKKSLVDYTHSILSLSSSVLKHYGAETNHKTLPIFDMFLKKNYKNVVVMLFDGMGTAILEKHLKKEAFLWRNQKDTISSVFPPTTTAATTTIETGLSPIEHGWLGWNLFFDEIGSNVSIFPNIIPNTDGKPAADYHVARKYIPCTNIYSKITAATYGRVRAVSVSPFSGYKSESVADICDTVKALCSEPGNKYIYTYWPQPDADMHSLGTKDIKITEDILEINFAVEKLCKVLSDTLVIVTADHGHINTDWKFLPDYPDVEECLSKMPSIEARATAYFIKDGMKKRFEKAFNKHFGNEYLLLTKEQVLGLKLFGEGIPHPRSPGFIGDYLAIATGNTSIDCVSAKKSHCFRATHAGMTKDEIFVPFIAVECI